MLGERWLPEDFVIPTAETTRWKLRPLSMDLLAQDFHCYMSSVDHLRNGGMLQPPGAPWVDWPRPDLTVRWALVALGEAEYAMASGYRVEYAILSPDETESFGAVYVFPPSKEGFDAEVRMFTRADVTSEYDGEVFDFIRTWVPEQYPFLERIAWPGREIGWDEWESIPDL